MFGFILMLLTIGYVVFVAWRNLQKFVTPAADDMQSASETEIGHEQDFAEYEDYTDYETIIKPVESKSATAVNNANAGNKSSRIATQVQDFFNEEEQEAVSDIIPDFTDEEQMRRAIISAEILNKKYD